MNSLKSKLPQNDWNYNLAKDYISKILSENQDYRSKLNADSIPLGLWLLTVSQVSSAVGVDQKTIREWFLRLVQDETLKIDIFPIWNIVTSNDDGTHKITLVSHKSLTKLVETTDDVPECEIWGITVDPKFPQAEGEYSAANSLAVWTIWMQATTDLRTLQPKTNDDSHLPSLSDLIPMMPTSDPICSQKRSTSTNVSSSSSTTAVAKSTNTAASTLPSISSSVEPVQAQIERQKPIVKPKKSEEKKIHAMFTSAAATTSKAQKKPPEKSSTPIEQHSKVDDDTRGVKRSHVSVLKTPQIDQSHATAVPRKRQCLSRSEITIEEEADLFRDEPQQPDHNQASLDVKSPHLSRRNNKPSPIKPPSLAAIDSVTTKTKGKYRMFGAQTTPNKPAPKPQPQAKKPAPKPQPNQPNRSNKKATGLFKFMT